MRQSPAALIALLLCVNPLSAQAITFDITTSNDFLNPGDGVCSVREALLASELQAPSGNAEGECPAGTGVDTLNLSAIANETLTLIAAQPLTVAPGLDITIDGFGVEFDGDGNSRVLELGDGSSFTANNLFLQNGATNDRGGAINGDSVTLILNSCFVSDNVAGTKGGGIFMKDSDVTINVTTITGNTAGSLAPSELGGGIAVEGGSLNMIAATVTNNTVAGVGGFGGGISAVATVFTIQQLNVNANMADTAGGMLLSNLLNAPTLSQLTVNGNTAKRGGGLVLADGTFELIRPTINNNRATAEEGGGLVVIDSTVTFTDVLTSIEDNESDASFGGGIHATNSDIVINTARIRGNKAARSGGGIFLSNSTLEISQSVISENEVTNGTESGGALFATTNSSVKLTETEITGNTAPIGGALSLESSSPVSLRQSLVANNAAKSSGGGFAVDASVLTLAESTASDNEAPTGNIARISGDGSLDLIHATATGVANLGNDPTLFFEGTGGNLTMTNSILFTGAGFDDCGFQAGALVSVTLAGNNLVGDPGDCVFAGGGTLLMEDPMLEPLADNGGRTDTRKPMTGSPVIEAGDDALVEDSAIWDQRGAGRRRVQGLGTELGAFEFQGGRIRIVTSAFDVNEDAGFAEFIFERLFDSEGEVFITLNSQDQQAIAPEDYTAIANQQLSWADGELGQKTVQVVVKEDLEEEEPENFQLLMSGPTGGAIIGPQGLQARARIIDVAPPAGVFKDDFEEDVEEGKAE